MSQRELGLLAEEENRKDFVTAMMRRFPVRRRRDQWQFFESRLYLGLLPLLTGTLANGKDFFPFLVLLLVSNYQLSRSSLESDKGP